MYSIDKNLKEILDKIIGIDKLYEQVRVVDPIKKRILIYKDNHLTETNNTCHVFWSQNKPCTNCVSMRAYNEDDLFTKIEYNPNKIYMLTAVPIALDERKVVIELLRDITNSMIVDEDLKVKNLLKQTNEATMTDGLTNIYNKRYILEKLPHTVFEHHLKKEPLSLIMADIDFFKRVNDTYGHLGGDYILKEFDKILKSNIQEEKDWVARFGGEEFLVCFQNTKKNDALEIAERMRKTIEEKTFIYKNKEIKITSSFGVSFLTEKENDYEVLIERADKNLYQAKKEGRNRVIG